VSAGPSFAGVFVEACRRKGLANVADVRLAHSECTSDSPLVSVSGGEGGLAFTEAGLSFRGQDGKGVRYSWEELDFILPQDVSLAGDQLEAYSALEDPARRLADKASAVILVLAAVVLAALVAHGIFDVVAPILHWLQSLPSFLRWLASSFLLVLLIAAGMALAPSLLGLVVALVATGSLIAGLRRLIASLVQPIALGFLKARFKQFPNGLRVINASWVKAPGGVPTTEMLDLILLGVKLRRRGIV
jgi:hypothetical protein